MVYKTDLCQTLIKQVPDKNMVHVYSWRVSEFQIFWLRGWQHAICAIKYFDFIETDSVHGKHEMFSFYFLNILSFC